MRVSSLRRYPVKSMMGEEIPSVDLGAGGLDGDRRLALLEVETGLVASAKQPSKWGRLLRCRAVLAGGAVKITLPSGQVVAADDPGVDDLLSAYADRRVSLSTVPPADPHLAREWPEVPGLAPAEVVRQRRQVTPMSSAAPGTFFDYAPVHIVTLSSLQALRAAAAGDFAAARFRPNVVLDTPDRGFVEQGWVGRQLRIGDAIVLEVINHTPRCAVPSLEQGDLPASPEVLRTVVARNRVNVEGRRFGCVGVYARVIHGGSIAIGDEVRLS